MSFFHSWASGHEDIRVAVLTSTRAVPGAVVDEYSDYDIILVVQDVLPYHTSRDWLAAFGSVLALYHDPLNDEDGLKTTGYVVQYASGLKIDFTLWPLEMLSRILTRAKLDDEMDAGYRVLLDKDGTTSSLPAPTYRAYIPTPPDQSAFMEVIENFYVAAMYVARYLCRGDEVAAQHLLDNELRQQQLIPMLTWHFEIERNWSVKPGLYGRGIWRYLRHDLYEELTAAFPAFGDTWAGLENAAALMLRSGSEVGAKLGFEYPVWMHERAMELIGGLKTKVIQSQTGRLGQ